MTLSTCSGRSNQYSRKRGSISPRKRDARLERDISRHGAHPDGAHPVVAETQIALVESRHDSVRVRNSLRPDALSQGRSACPLQAISPRPALAGVRNFEALTKFDLPCELWVFWSMDHLERITLEPGKRSGKPCIRGLRISVYDVLEYLASGMTEAEILADFPDLEREDIRASLAFAAARERRLVSIPPG